MGEISDEDRSDFAPVEVDIRAMDDKSAEDLFFSSSSFVHPRDIGPDTSFGWDSTPLESSLTVNVTQSTPSPRSKFAPVSSKLEKKYRPRDSGIVLSEDESNSTGPHVVADFIPPAPRHRYTLGRSESVSLSMPRASTSVSTLGSGSSDQELVTPIFGPSTSSGWPHLTSSSSAASSLGTVDVNSVDAFILRTLTQASRRGEHARPGSNDGGGIRPPGTPQKRAKTAMVLGGARLWQSAVASKIGFDFGNDDDADDNEDGCSKGPADNGRTKKNKKAPRKSLPAAFPLLSKTGRGRGRAPGTEDSDEEPRQSDVSPTERKALYDGLGLGRPSVTKAGGTGWLLRRSSSGAISSAASGSGSMGGDGSPTGTTGTTRRAFHFHSHLGLAYLLTYA
jgi:mitosis inhibitor protein kinase SWE1